MAATSLLNKGSYHSNCPFFQSKSNEILKRPFHSSGVEKRHLYKLYVMIGFTKND